MDKTNYAYRIDVSADFDTVVRVVTDKLGDEGFGVLTEIDVKATLKKKLDVDFRRYQILGACNPPLAHRALLAEEDIGLLLPCNVIVAELDDNKTRLAAVDPQAAMAVSGSEKLRPIAEEVGMKLQRVMAAAAKKLGGGA